MLIDLNKNLNIDAVLEINLLLRLSNAITQSLLSSKELVFTKAWISNARFVLH